MGFLDNILSAVGGAVGGFLTGGPAGAIAGGIGGLIAGDTDTPAPTPTAATTLARPSMATTALAPTPTAAAPGGTTVGKVLQQFALGGLPAFIAGTTGILDAPKVDAKTVIGGKNFVVTQVNTFNAAGQLIKQKNLAGRPFLMNKDLVVAKRVFRTIQKASTKLPRKTVRESPSKQLTDAVTEKALSNVLTGHHNGHHTNG